MSRRARKLTLKARAERHEETRRRITEAAVALHESVGPARASVSAIARKAGVQRLTFYRHFPDVGALFQD
jgi:AcrR family transcriptional regulator